MGEPGRGVRTIIEMVQRTRLDCVLGTAAGMRQSVAEAVWHARGREAFGALLVDQPAMTSVLADLALEAEAAMLTGLRLAQLFEAEASDRDVALRRLATPVSKYWVCKRGPHHAYEALECLGGNGYTEAFPLARRYREQPVMAIWEGSGNVIALDVLRALDARPGLGGRVRRRAGDDAGRIAACSTRTSHARCRCSESVQSADSARGADAGPPPQRVARPRVPGVADAAPRAVDATPRPSSRHGSARIARRSTACSPRGTDAAAIVARH